MLLHQLLQRRTLLVLKEGWKQKYPFQIQQQYVPSSMMLLLTSTTTINTTNTTANTNNIIQSNILRYLRNDSGPNATKTATNVGTIGLVTAAVVTVAVVLSSSSSSSSSSSDCSNSGDTYRYWNNANRRSNNNNNRFAYCDAASETTTATNSSILPSSSSSSPSSSLLLSSSVEKNDLTTKSCNLTAAAAPPVVSTTTASTTTTTTKSNIQRKMTSIGRFALVSETKYNPSIITFVIQLRNMDDTNNPQFTANDFIRLWATKQISEKHPRFHQIIHTSSNLKDKKGTKSSSSLFFHPTVMTDISDHVTESVLPCNRLQLQQIIAKMQLSQWDLSNSLWHITICNNSNNKYMSTPSYRRPSSDNIPTFSYLTRPMVGIDTSNSTGSENENKNDRRPLVSSPTLLLFRGHHVLADGASMAAAFMDLFDEADQLRNQIVSALQQYRLRRRRLHQQRNILHWLWRKWVQIVQLCYGTMQSFAHLIRLAYYQLFVDNNPWKVIRKQYNRDKESATVDRIVSWSDVTSVDEAKWVADTLSDDRGNHRMSFKITINDVFIACVTAAMSKQLQFHRQRMQELPSKDKQTKNNRTNMLDEQKFMHVAVPVHLKGGVVLPGESVGNCIGALVARVPCEMDNNVDDDYDNRDNEAKHSVQRLHEVSRELHTIKRTPTAIISYSMAKVLSAITTWNIVPLSWISYLYANANAGSMVVVSNNRGPSIPVHVNGHVVESITGFVPLPPGIPVGVVVMSYAGRLNCTISAEPWAVPDGDQFMVWILEEYVQLVNAAKLKETRPKN